MTSTTQALLGVWASPTSMGPEKELKAEFERVTLEHLSHLYTSAVFLTKDKAEAEDLVQETYLRAFRFFDKFERGTNSKAWLLSILRHLFINRYQQKKREPTTVDWEQINELYDSMVEQPESSGMQNPEHHFVTQIMDDEIEAALRALPEEFRTTIVLVDIEELNYEEAARVMGCPVGTVRSRLSRGRRMLQVALRDHAIQRGLITRSGDAAVQKSI